jgi:hypothetical protein
MLASCFSDIIAPQSLATWIHQIILQFLPAVPHALIRSWVAAAFLHHDSSRSWPQSTLVVASRPKGWRTKRKRGPKPALCSHYGIQPLLRLAPNGIRAHVLDSACDAKRSNALDQPRVVTIRLQINGRSGGNGNSGWLPPSPGLGSNSPAWPLLPRSPGGFRRASRFFRNFFPVSLSNYLLQRRLSPWREVFDPALPTAGAP